MPDFIYAAKAGDKWLVATASSPYLCVEGATKDDALAKAARAVRLINASSEDISRHMEGHAERSPEWHELPARELTAA